jgi:hypothetical protein
MIQTKPPTSAPPLGPTPNTPNQPPGPSFLLQNRTKPQAQRRPTPQTLKLKRTLAEHPSRSTLPSPARPSSLPALAPPSDDVIHPYVTLPTAHDASPRAFIGRSRRPRPARCSPRAIKRPPPQPSLLHNPPPPPPPRRPRRRRRGALPAAARRRRKGAGVVTMRCLAEGARPRRSKLSLCSNPFPCFYSP